MAGSQGMRKKEDITTIINSILEEASRSRKGFTPEVVREFEAEGRKAAEARAGGGRQAAPQRRDVQQQAAPRQREESMHEVTPSRQLNIVVRRAEETEQQRASLSPVMTQRAIESAVGLGERLELAAQGRALNLRSWVTG
ncbi:hypothetical protein L0Y65_04355 [Candidatus Micrarchaeota archaeon]|nr:hypothetical protein [Candidatus Micrarchaeota archaeon]